MLKLLYVPLSPVAAKKNRKDSSKAKPRPKVPPPMVAPSISAYRPTVSVEQEDDFMSEILGNMDTLPATSSALPHMRSRKRKPSSDYDDDDDDNSYQPPARLHAPAYRSKPSFGDTSSDGFDEDLLPPSSDDVFMSPKKKMRVNSEAMTPATERLASLTVHGSSDVELDTSFDDVDMDAFMDTDFEDEGPKVKSEFTELTRKLSGATSVFPTKPEDAPSWLSVYDSLSVSTEESLGSLASSTSAASTKQISALEPDGSLRFFWLDYLEHDGKIYFIGKIKDKVSGVWLSCCVTVEGIQRNLFVLPREKRMEQDEEGELCETDIVPETQDVFNDFDMIRKKIGIKSFRTKFVKRKYAFGESDVPRGENQWLKVVYGFNGTLQLRSSVILTR